MAAGLVRYRRTVLRLREKFKEGSFTYKDLEDAIFLECGTDARTVKAAVDRMLRLNFIVLVNEEREFGKPYVDKYKLTCGQNEYF